MPDYMTLLGAEDVQRAANKMITAAELMARAADQISESQHRHEQFLTTWLAELREFHEPPF